MQYFIYHDSKISYITTHCFLQFSSKVSTALIQRGTLRKNDVFVAGSVWGKVKSMRNDAGRLVKEAGPSAAVEIAGWKELPSAGDMLWQVESEVG